MVAGGGRICRQRVGAVATLLSGNRAQCPSILQDAFPTFQPRNALPPKTTHALAPQTQFKAAGATQFGSGWAWLVADKSGKLSIEKTPNAVTPVVEGKAPILTMVRVMACDVLTVVGPRCRAGLLVAALPSAPQVVHRRRYTAAAPS
jgi:hypothetical protein